MESQNRFEDKLDFKQIVLSHLKRILEISSKELRDTTRRIESLNHTQTVEQEDTRLSYIQSIENLSYVLIPYFDDQIQEVYDKCIKIINAFSYEIKTLLKKTYDKVSAEVGKEDLGNSFVLEMKLKYAKKLFIALNLLLKRNDYLKGSLYGEDTGEEVVEVEAGENE